MSGSLRSVLVHGKVMRSSGDLFSRLQRTGQTVPRQSGRWQRDWQLLNGLPSRWQSSCWQQKRPLRMRQRRALSMSAERAGRLRPKGMFGKLLQGAGAVEAVEVVVGMRHRHHRHRRHRHRRQRHHRRHHHRRHHHRCLS